MVTPLEAFASTGELLSVNCNAASFATEDQIQWIKLNNADFEDFKMVSLTECASTSSSGGSAVSEPSDGSGSVLVSGMVNQVLHLHSVGVAVAAIFQQSTTIYHHMVSGY